MRVSAVDSKMRQVANTTPLVLFLTLLLQIHVPTTAAPVINVFPHVHSSKMPGRATKVLHPNDMGVHKLQSSGPLVLSNGSSVVVAAVTYMKMVPATRDGDLELRCDGRSHTA